MSQIYFTSSTISSKQFLSIEQLIEHLGHQNILLCFDTNVVVYFRDMFLNPLEFIEKHKDISNSVRYLVEQIDRYDLQVDARFGVEESSRNINDFSINQEKHQQTHEAVSELFKMNMDKLDIHIKKGGVFNPIKNNTERKNSKIASLNQRSSFQNLLIISYVLSLKTRILFAQVENKTLSELEAMKAFCLFMTNEVDCVSATSYLYALHLFGKVEDFKGILINKKNSSFGTKLHQIFNGAIDLIFSTMINHLPSLEKKYENLTPILVTFDKRLSTIHSLLTSRIIINNVNSSFNPVLTELTFFDKMKWSEKELSIFKELVIDDSVHRFISQKTKGESASYLIPLVEKYEKEFKELCY
jgi:hypothetical protein